MHAFGGRGVELNYVKLSQVRLSRIMFSRNETNFAGLAFYCLDFKVFFRSKIHLPAINRQKPVGHNFFWVFKVGEGFFDPFLKF